MIVAVSADRNDAYARVSPLFERSRYFILFDTKTDASEVAYNPYMDSIGDGGIHAAQMLIERNVDVVVSAGIGANAFRVLSAADVRVYKCAGETAGEAFGLMIDGRLQLAGNPDDEAGRRRRRRLGRRD